MDPLHLVCAPQRAGHRLNEVATSEVWLDLSTAPDPLFFRPIARRLESLGLRIWVTAREFGETVEIARRCGFDVDVVGRHGGRSAVGKVAQITARSVELGHLARRHRPRLALSFNSYAQAIAARALGVPFMTVADYEYQPANHLAFRLARTVMVPSGFDAEMLRRQGASMERVVFFDGLKEDVTVEDFVPDEQFPARLESLGVGGNRIVATVRPGATSSAYHRFANDWFYDVTAHLASHPDVSVVALPRYASQADRIRALGQENIVIPPTVLDGLNLVYWSDMVVSGGGSMNREAVVLGTPAYTVFAGRMAGVDRELVRRGRMVEIRSPDDLARLAIARRSPRNFAPRSNQTVQEILDAVLRLAAPSPAGGNA